MAGSRLRATLLMEACLPPSLCKPWLVERFMRAVNRAEEHLRTKAERRRLGFRVVREYLEHQERVKKVFSMVLNIHEYLSSGCARSWIHAFPVSTKAIQHWYVQDEMKAYIKAQVGRRLGQGRSIPELALCELVDRAVIYPFNQNVGLQAVIEHSIYLASTCVEQRRRDLELALLEKDLALRNDSKLCQGYLQGIVGQFLPEVVGVVAITTTLISLDYVIWSRTRLELEAFFRHAVSNNDNINWEQALDLTLELELLYYYYTEGR